jgi:hypothetical protein
MVRHPEAFADFAQNKDASDALFDAGGESNGRAEE